MKIQYASDLHLEFSENRDYIEDNPIVPEGDILILAGDIVPFSLIDQVQDFFSYVSDHFESTYWIPGNHEYYHFDASTKSGAFKESIRNNVYLLNNQAIIEGDVKMIFSTLWSKISGKNLRQIENGMNDFRVIRYQGKPLSVLQYNQLHEDSLLFIDQELTKDNKAPKKIVITHHAPTFQNYPPKYLGSVLNEAFATRLDDLIEKTAPDYWLYGHHHQNIAEFKLGKAKLVTNQLGYVHHNEHRLFQPDKIIDL